VGRKSQPGGSLFGVPASSLTTAEGGLAAWKNQTIPKNQNMIAINVKK
jgi:hypothetical protein